MRILLIFTGGTIGSALSDGWISPDPSAKYTLINRFREVSETQADFDVLSPYTILSENLSARELNMLIRCVNENIQKSCYDGIIIAHGTDTLQYSAAALALSLGRDCIPVVLVSSNYPLEDARANGLPNFIAAVDFICSECGRGVFVSYKNRENRVNILPAEGLFSHPEMSDELHAVGSAFAYYENGKITLNAQYKETQRSDALGVFAFSAESGILVVNAVPGDDFSYDLCGKKAVILRPYHSGTLSTDSSALREFCKKAKKHDVPVFLVNAPSGSTYESAKLYDDLGIIALPDAPFVFSYMKIWAQISVYGDVEYSQCKLF